MAKPEMAKQKNGDEAHLIAAFLEGNSLWGGKIFLLERIRLEGRESQLSVRSGNNYDELLLLNTFCAART